MYPAGTCALTCTHGHFIQSLIAASSEIAVYAALFLTLNLAAVLGGGLSIPAPRYADKRFPILAQAFCVVSCFLTNIVASIILRLSSSALARESDMLVFISKIRYWNWINIGLFALGSTFGMYISTAVFLITWIQGDYCLDGSLSFHSWFYEWAEEDYPAGAGVVHPEGEPIKNAWALKAAELNIDRPTLKTARTTKGMEDHPTYKMYREFMQDHFNLNGNQCYGLNSWENYPNPLLWFLILFPSLIVLFWIFFVRNSRQYWLIGTRCCGINDPFDLSYAFEDFKARAEIGARLAARDTNNDKFIDAATELQADGSEVGDSEDAGVPLTTNTMTLGGATTHTQLARNELLLDPPPPPTALVPQVVLQAGRFNQSLCWAPSQSSISPHIPSSHMPPRSTAAPAAPPPPPLNLGMLPVGAASPVQVSGSYFGNISSTVIPKWLCCSSASVFDDGCDS